MFWTLKLFWKYHIAVVDEREMKMKKDAHKKNQVLLKEIQERVKKRWGKKYLGLLLQIL